MLKEQFRRARDLIDAQQYDEARALLNTIDHPKAQEWLAKLDTIAPESDATYQESLRVHEQFLHVRELIQAKQYDEARQILYTLDHPTAQEWLAKLDRIAPQPETESEPEEAPASRPVIRRRRNLPVMAGVFVLLILAGAAVFFGLWNNTAVDGADDAKTLAQYFPADTVGYISVRIDDATINQIDVLVVKFIAHLTNPLLMIASPIPTTLHGWLDYGVKDATGGSFETDVRSWLGEFMAAGAFNMHVLLDDDTANDTQIGLAGMVEIKDRAKADAFITQIMKDYVRSERDDFTLFESPEPTIDAATTKTVIMLTDRLLIVTTAASIPVFSTPLATSLSSDQGFNETLNELPADDYMAVFYLHQTEMLRITKAMSERVIQKMTEELSEESMQRASASPFEGMSAMQKALLAADIRSALGFTILDGRSPTLDVVQNIRDIETLKEAGFIAPWSDPVDPAFLAYVPATASIVLHGTDLKGQYEAEKINTGMSPTTQVMGLSGLPSVSVDDETLMTVQERLPASDIDLEKEVIPLLSGDCLFFVTYSPVTTPAAPISAQNIVNAGFIIEVVDPEKARQLIEKLAALPPMPEVTNLHRETIEGVSVVAFSMPMEDGSLLELVVGANDRILYAGTKSAAEQIFSGTGGFNTQPEYTASAGYAVENRTGIFYVNRTGGALFGDILMLMGRQTEKVMAEMMSELNETTPPPMPDRSTQYAETQGYIQKALSLFESASASSNSSEVGVTLNRLVLTLVE